MPFVPMTRTPKATMDRWAILADSLAEGVRWIRKNFHLFKPGKPDPNAWMTVAPIFDINDPFEVMIIVDRNQIYGKNFYRMIDIRSELNRQHDEVLEENSRLSLLERTLRQHPQGPKFQHPHPDPSTWKDLDRYDVRRRWISPDPFPPTKSNTKSRTRLFARPSAGKAPRDS